MARVLVPIQAMDAVQTEAWGLLFLANILGFFPQRHVILQGDNACMVALLNQAATPRNLFLW
ncbi:MAG: hypothetical protein AAF629_23640 [Chloroflexota bacterium]